MRFVGHFSVRTLMCMSAALGAGLAFAIAGIEKATAGPENPASKSSAKAFLKRAGTGAAYWGPGDLYTFLTTANESNGSLFQFEALVPPGGGPPPHIHLDAEETFYLVSGSLELRLGTEIVTAKAGDFINIPRGTAHGFKNVGNDTAKMLATFAPGGFEKYFQEVFPVATDRNAAPPPVTDALIQKLKDAAPKYNVQFMEPAADKK